MLSGTYETEPLTALPNALDWTQALGDGTLTACELMQHYCRKLYGICGNYGEVAWRIDLDGRTVEKYVEDAD